MTQNLLEPGTSIANNVTHQRINVVARALQQSTFNLILSLHHGRLLGIAKPIADISRRGQAWKL
jgi:hypothetical protein